jgi:ankyrin repeat protein
MFFESLPLELFRDISSYLQFRDIASLKRTSHWCNSVFQFNYNDEVTFYNFYKFEVKRDSSPSFLSVLHTRLPSLNICHVFHEAVKHGNMSLIELVLSYYTSHLRPPQEEKQRNLSFSTSFEDGYLCCKTSGRLSECINYALILSSRSGDSKIVQLLLSHGADPSSQQGQALISAADGGYIGVAMLLLNHPLEIRTKWIDEAMIRAAGNGHLEVVEHLIQRGANVHAFNDCALIRASGNGLLPVVARLLKLGADPSVYNGEALIAACGSGYIEVAEALLPLYSSGTIKGQALISASRNGHVKIAELLLKQGADVHCLQDDSLVYAARNGHFEVVKLLLEHGADKGAQNNLALDLSKRYGHHRVYCSLA